MTNDLPSNWTINAILSQLPGYRRIDDAVDLLAFRLVGRALDRSAYIYVYGEDPDLIYYDLEDASTEDGAWDNAIERGAVRSIEELRSILRRWLGSGN